MRIPGAFSSHLLVIHRGLAGKLLLRSLQVRRRGGLPVGFRVVLLLADGFEQQSVPADVDVRVGDLPVAGGYLAALDEERSTLVDLAEDAEPELYVIGEGALEDLDAVTRAGYDHVAGHDAENARLHVGRVEGRVGAEAKGDLLGVFAG